MVVFFISYMGSPPREFNHIKSWNF